MNDPKRRGHSAPDEHGTDFELPAPPQISGTKVVLSAGAILTVLAVAFGVTYAARRRRDTEIVQSTEEAIGARTRVDVLAPKVLSSDHALSLIGSISPSAETTLYPQANGYIRSWVVDIGDNVKKGDLLAEVDTPELDQQLQQAEAQRAQAEAQVLQARANAGLAKADLARYKSLTPAGVTSESELDQKRAQADVSLANLEVANAAVAAQEANIRRLNQLKSFARVVAPFEGKITQRWAERGALVTVGNSTPLFHISAMDPGRVFIAIPQDVVPSVRPDTPAQVLVREFPDRTFDGKLVRTTGQLDEATRTMKAEVRLPNPKGELVPGMFVRVVLSLPTRHRVLEVPSTAVVSDARGVFVYTVVQDGGTDQIHLAPVVIERDVGATMEISSGLSETDAVVKVSSSQLLEGLPVEVHR
jgi:RND family efflux transporter MFP subunit